MGIELIITELRPQVREVMASSSIGSLLPKKLFCKTLDEVL
jgi:hypothetical protein